MDIDSNRAYLFMILGASAGAIMGLGSKIVFEWLKGNRKEHNQIYCPQHEQLLAGLKITQELRDNSIKQIALLNSIKDTMGQLYTLAMDIFKEARYEDRK